jgi:antitoxin component YwqK of YwqJK toxin-antitoxin module
MLNRQLHPCTGYNWSIGVKMRLLNKITILFVMCLAVLIGCEKTIETEKKVIDFDRLQERQGIFYAVNATEPYTGAVIDLYQNGQKMYERNYVGGTRQGLTILWFENGQKQGEGNFVDGKESGLHTQWYENGQKESEGNFVDGQRNGRRTMWFKNGQIMAEGNYANKV